MGEGGPRFGRRQVVQAAAVAKVSVADMDRAQVLGQLAALLLSHRHLHDNLAYKGGAIMHLVDGSPRRSNDLDAHVVSKGPIQKTWLIQALSTDAARKVVFGPPSRFREGKESITIVALDCRAPSGRSKVTVSINISWESPLCLPHDWMDITVKARTVRIPVMHRSERCAEKLAAFLRRIEVNDTYDLNVYAARLGPGDRNLLPELMRVKLAHDDRWDHGQDMRAVFDASLKSAEAEWKRSAHTLNVPKEPSWEDLVKALRPFRTALPARLDTNRRRPRW